VRIFRPGYSDPDVLLVAKDANWWIESPEHYPAAKYTVDSLVREIQSLTIERKIATTGEEDAARYGFGEPEFVVEFSTSETRETIEVGFKNPIGNKVYVRRKGSGSVALVNQGFDYQLKKLAKDFRMREVVVHRERVEEGARLEDEGEVDLVAGLGVGGVELADRDPAAGRALEAGDVLQDDGLAGAAGAHDAEDLAGLDVEVDAVEHRGGAELLGQLADGDAEGFADEGGGGVVVAHEKRRALVTK
jgi:hypothetical protein